MKSVAILLTALLAGACIAIGGPLVPVEVVVQTATNAAETNAASARVPPGIIHEVVIAPVTAGSTVDVVVARSRSTAGMDWQVLASKTGIVTTVPVVVRPALWPTDAAGTVMPSNSIPALFGPGDSVVVAVSNSLTETTRKWIRARLLVERMDQP